VLFILWTLVSASSQTTWLFIFSRFLTGCVVASNVLNPAIIGDMLPPEQRGTAMATLMLAPLLGGAVAPAIAGAIAQSIGWRRILWIGAGIAGVCELAFLLFLRETYKISILRRRLKRARRDSYVSIIDPEKESATMTIWRFIKRPAAVLADSFVLQILSLYGALIFAFFYIMATTLPMILQKEYGFSPQSTGSAFLSFSKFPSPLIEALELILKGIGSCVGIVVCNLTLDRIYMKLRTVNNGIGLPEHRMPLTIVSVFMLPLAVLLFGWTAENHWPVEVLLLSVGLLGFFLLLCMVPLMAYVVDAFGIYSASALTAVLVSRCLMSTFLPLIVAPLTGKFGYGWGFVVFAAMCFAVAPVPLLVMRYGYKWRQRSIYTKDT
jgi:MFS family permease